MTPEIAHSIDRLLSSIEEARLHARGLVALSHAKDDAPIRVVKSQLDLLTVAAQQAVDTLIKPPHRSSP